MYNLSDYIVLSRSAYLVNATCMRSLHEHSDMNYEQLSVIDNNIINLFSIVYPGSSIRKFVVSRYEDMDVKKYIPIYLLEIPSFKDGKDLIAPIYLDVNGLSIIRTAFTLTSDLEDQEFIYNIFDIYPLKDNIGAYEFTEYMKQNDYLSEELNTKLESYFLSSGFVLGHIYSKFDHISEFNITPTKLNDETAKSRYIQNNYVMETPDPDMVQSMPINPDLFMPLVLKKEENNNSISFLKETHARSKNEFITYVKSYDSLENILESSATDKILVKAPDECDFIIVDIDSFVYIGNGKVVSIHLENAGIDNTGKDMSKVKYASIDLNSIVLFESDQDLDLVNNSPYIDESILGTEAEKRFATESMVTDMKQLAIKAKEVGFDFKSDIMPNFRRLVGLPKDIVVMVYKFFTRAFNTVNLMERNKAVDYQEKLLNDEISEFSENMERIVSNTTIAAATLLIPTNLMIQALLFVLAKSVNENMRIRALERLEHKMEDMIDRVDKKIEFATQEYNKEAVNELKKERAMYLFAVERILAVKKKVYKKDRKASAFKRQEEDN